MYKTSIPPLPKTVCLPFSQEVMTVVMKNWLPLVFGPALAMLNRPATSCFRLKFSSYKSSVSGLLEQMCFNNRQMEGHIKIKMAVYSTGNE